MAGGCGLVYEGAAARDLPVNRHPHRWAGHVTPGGFPVTRILSLSAAVFALALFGPAARAADHDKHSAECAKACDDCARACEACGTHCLKMVVDGKKEHVTTLRTCRDCATACSASAAVVARQGPFAGLMCTACAEACRLCGEECDKRKDDAMMKECADECRKCEKACREMLKHTTAAK